MKKSIKKIFTQNLTLKIISLSLSIFLWFFITFRGQTETSVEATVEFKNLPPQMEILKQSIKKVTLAISTRERILREINQKDVRVIVDLSNAKLGENSIPITKSSLKLPRGVEVLRVEPSTVKLYIDKKESKTVPVKARLIGEPSKSYKISSVEVYPSKINIEGPKRELDRIYLIRTEAIDIEGINENLTLQAKIDPEGRVFRTDIDTVSINIKLRRLR
ncbi:YbbR-like domain-containing protein [Candidatus Caldatribacterium sp.]|uniref:CdaR family protein n=1 Tax=Candidatus Caldatribacterium sp. TaxID=2282143 RepID=UPI003843F2B9|nr:CdaR family protein [Candidatus Caldatribacterium sp.]